MSIKSTIHQRPKTRLVLLTVLLAGASLGWFALLSDTAKTPQWNGQSGILSALYMVPVYCIIFAMIVISLLLLVSDLLRKWFTGNKWAKRNFSQPMIRALITVTIIALLITLAAIINYIRHYNHFIRLY